jgi:hypothetical protein
LLRGVSFKKEIVVNLSTFELFRIIQNGLFKRITLFEIIDEVKLRRFKAKSPLKIEAFLW